MSSIDPSLLNIIDLCCSRSNLVRRFPKARRHGQGIDPLLFPPNLFVAAAMEFAVMQSADRNGELIADFAAHGSLFGEFEVMSV